MSSAALLQLNKCFISSCMISQQCLLFALCFIRSCITSTEVSRLHPNFSCMHAYMPALDCSYVVPAGGMLFGVSGLLLLLLLLCGAHQYHLLLPMIIHR